MFSEKHPFSLIERKIQKHRIGWVHAYFASTWLSEILCQPRSGPSKSHDSRRVWKQSGSNKSIKSVEPLSKESVLFASSCAEVVFQLWLNCRRNSKDCVHGIRSLHQCDDIVLSLSSEGRVIQNCWVFLSRTANTNIGLNNYSGGIEGKFDQKLGCLYSSLLSLRSKCLQILEKEAMHCTQIETDGSTIVKRKCSK